MRDYLDLRSVVRAHVIDWRKDMEKRGLAPSTIRRKLLALSSLFDYLCERNAVAGNPVDGVKRSIAEIFGLLRIRLFCHAEKCVTVLA
jgi:site-specific recombinase XerC